MSIEQEIACLLQLLNTQEELERLRAEKKTSLAGDDTLKEVQQQNSTLLSRVYVQHFL